MGIELLKVVRIPVIGKSLLNSTFTFVFNRSSMRIKDKNWRLYEKITSVDSITGFYILKNKLT
jgi:hypothetical protein